MMSTDKSPQTHHRSLLKSSGIVASGVLSSRVLGFVRDVILAQLLGTGLAAEAFFVAQRIPNLLRDLAGEGAANAAVVPVLAEYSQTKTREQWLELLQVVMAWGIIILGGLTIMGMIAAPWIVRVIAPGFTHDAVKLRLTIDLTRIMFPYLVLIGLTALQAGVLYSLRAFIAPSFGPCLLNVAMILAAWVACLFSWPVAYTLAGGVIIGGVAQFGLQATALRRREIRWRWPVSLNHAGARQIGRLMLPRLWGSAVYQLNVFVDTFCASLAIIVGSGGIAAIYYANRLIQFPLGVFAYALSSVSLPSLSQIAQQGDMPKFKSTLLFALRKLLLILVPTAVVMAIGSKWIIHIIFQHGAFNAYSASVTSQVLFYAALGLPFFGAARLMVSGFYALQDTKTPVRAATVCLVVNVVLNGVLMFPMKIGGIALASTLASMLNCFLLWQALNRKWTLEIK